MSADDQKPKRGGKDGKGWFAPRNGGRPAMQDSTRMKHEIQLLMKQGMSWRKACEQAGVSTNTAMRWRKADPIFDGAIEGIMANNGTTKPAPKIKEPVRTKEMIHNSAERESVIEEVCKGLAFGLEIDFSCMLASIDKRALREWMSEDHTIMTRINQARAKNMAWWIEKIRKGAETDWRAAVCYLERMFPHLWAEVKQVEITARKAVDDPMELKTIEVERAAIQNVKQMSNEELMALASKHTGEI